MIPLLAAEYRRNKQRRDDADENPRDQRVEASEAGSSQI